MKHGSLEHTTSVVVGSGFKRKGMESPNGVKGLWWMILNKWYILCYQQTLRVHFFNYQLAKCLCFCVNLTGLIFLDPFLFYLYSTCTCGIEKWRKKDRCGPNLNLNFLCISHYCVTQQLWYFLYTPLYWKWNIISPTKSICKLSPRISYLLKPTQERFVVSRYRYVFMKLNFHSVLITLKKTTKLCCWTRSDVWISTELTTRALCYQQRRHSKSISWNQT